MQKLLFSAGTIFGFFTVLLGAFGAHGLKKTLTPDMLAIFETGVRYQAYHTFALLACAWAVSAFYPPRVIRAAACFTAGIIIFSGSLYILAITGLKKWGAVTPVGGVLLMLGWIFLFLSAHKRSQS